MNLDSIEALAKAATPGPWFAENNTVYVLHGAPLRNRFSALIQSGRRDDAGLDELTANAAFMAAANPAAVLAMVAVCRAAKAALTVLDRAADDGDISDCWRAAVPIRSAIAALDSVEGQTK